MKLVLFETVQNHEKLDYTIYDIIEKGKNVGRLVLREGNDEERYFEGHISYHIEEEYRGHHYAYQACLLLKDIVNKDHLLITCDPQNIASKKTIEKLNCEYLETKVIPQKLRKYFTQSEKEKRIYRWNLKG